MASSVQMAAVFAVGMPDYLESQLPFASQAQG
jgi:hypothetical protein